jgi:hypothetical protein
MSEAETQAQNEARIRDAMEAIRARIVKPVLVGAKQIYVYDTRGNNATE